MSLTEFLIWGLQSPPYSGLAGSTDLAQRQVKTQVEGEMKKTSYNTLKIKVLNQPN